MQYDKGPVKTIAPRPVEIREQSLLPIKNESCSGESIRYGIYLIERFIGLSDLPLIPLEKIMAHLDPSSCVALMGTNRALRAGTINFVKNSQKKEENDSRIEDREERCMSRVLLNPTGKLYLSEVSFQFKRKRDLKE